jgi:hypothetical protein
VEFLLVGDIDHTKTPDILMNGEFWEIKSPKTDKLSAIERNLKKASKQSSNIVIDSQRMSKLRDSSIQHYLINKLKEQKPIRKLPFVNRKRDVTS